MKKNRILSFAAGLLLSCSLNLSFAQSANDVPPITPEAQQDAQAYLTVSKSGNAKQMEAQKKAIVKKYKKNEGMLLSIGQYFFKNENYDEAIVFAKAAYDRDSKSVSAVLLEGDSYYAQNKYGEAAGSYEQARMINENDKRAYFSLVKVYKFIDPELALEIMNTIKEKYPDDLAIHKTMASIYYHQNDTAKANSTYKLYFNSVKLEDDVEAATEFAIVQFLNKDYAGSLKVVNAIIAKAPKEISLNRMKFYDYVELKQFKEADEASKSFFGQYADTLYNFSDYKYEGLLQSKLNNMEKSAVAYTKAIEMAPDEKKTALMKDLSDAYLNAGKYDEAADAYQKYIDKVNPESLVERYNKGRIYYTALADTTITDEQKKHFIEAGDALFKEVAAKDESYLGPFWSARINAMLDPESPNEVSMQQYAEAIKRLEGKDNSYDSKRVECLRYMTFYYFKTDDYDNSLAYAEKVLAISPNDGLATQIKNVLSQLKK